MERLHQAEERALQLEAEMANLQKLAAIRKAEADKCAQGGSDSCFELCLQARWLLLVWGAGVLRRVWECMLMSCEAMFNEGMLIFAVVGWNTAMKLHKTSV